MRFSEWKRWTHQLRLVCWCLFGCWVTPGQTQTTPGNLLPVTPQVAAASYTSMALDEVGRLWGWGNNSDGLLGRPAKSYVPVKVKRDRSYVRAWSGQNRQYLQDAAGAIWGAGANAFGQLGDGTNFLRRTNLVRLMGQYVDISPGGLHTLGLDSEGGLWSWGLNDSGQLGDGGATVSRKRAYKPSLPLAAISMAAGGYHSLAVLSDGSLWAWGANGFGQLGDGSTTDRSVPVQVGQGFVQVAAGRYFSMARKSDGSVWTWGANAKGQLGDGTTTQRASPVRIAGTWVRMGAGTFTGWLLDANDNLYQQGVSYTTSGAFDALAKLVMSGVAQVSAGEGHLLIQKKDGTLVALGDNSTGQLGIDDSSVAFLSTPRTVMASVKAFAAGTSANVAVGGDRSGYAWGDNGEGQLGLGRDLVLSTPILVAESVANFSITGASAFAVARNGDLYGWGANSDGRLGDGTRRDRANPVRIGSGFASVSTADLQTFALKPDGSLWGWGANDFGQLGLGDTTPRSTPTKIGEGYAKLAAGAYHTLGLRTDGSLWAWGRNQYGQLGNGLFEQRFGSQANATPLKVGDGFTDVMAGAHHSVALKADGTLWTWGWNEYGQVGDDSTTNRATPVQVMAHVGKLLSAQISTVVQAQDGKTYGWGYNGESRRRYNILLLGTTRFNVTKPTELPGDWVGVSAGAGHGLFLRRDGLLASVGYQLFGQLGDGSFDDVRQGLSLVLAGESTGFLDIYPSVANTTLGLEASRVFLRSYMEGNLNNVSLGFEVRLSPQALAQVQTVTSTLSGNMARPKVVARQDSSAGYAMYVVAIVPTSTGTAVFELTTPVDLPEPTWGLASFPLTAYLNNMTADAESVVTVDVLTNTDLTQLPGATLYIGYGTSSAEMAAAGRYKAFFTVPTDF